MVPNEYEELVEASMLLAKATKESAELLAEITERSVKQINWLTAAVVAVGLIQIIIALIALFISPRSK